MKLYIKQKVFSIGSQFTVKDELGDERYYVKSELFSLGTRFRITDQSGRERVFIQRHIFRIMPKFSITIDGSPGIEVVKRFTMLTPRYEVSGIGWEIEGDLLAHNYRIMQGSVPVASIQKVWIAWGDSYEINIAYPEDELAALAVVIAIDSVLSDNDTAFVKT